MLAGFTEHIGDQVGGAVDDEMLFEETGRGRDKTVELDDTGNPRQVAGKCGLRLGQDVDGAKFGCPLSLRECDIAPTRPVTATFPPSMGNCPERKSRFPLIT